MRPDFELSGILPFIRIGDSILIPTYFVVISLAFCVTLVWLVNRAEQSGFRRNSALDLAMVIMAAGFLGSRLFHVFFETPHVYTEDPWRVLEFWMGGFVWYGGALSAAGAALLWMKYRKMATPLWLDLLAPVASLGYIIGRISCLLTGCCYGSICHLHGFSFRHPTQAYAILWESVTLASLLYLEKKKPRWLKPAGQLFLTWVLLHSTGRIIMEVFRADDRGPTPGGLSLSTWISLALIAGTFFPFRVTSHHPRTRKSE